MNKSLPMLVMIGFMMCSNVLAEVPVYTAKIMNEDEPVLSGNEVFPGCSWYCGGFVSTTRASSTLPNHKGISYSADKAHDFDITTAWVEGKPDYGTGEYVEYGFDLTKRESPGLGVNALLMVNGYRKSKAVWKANSRVKRLKMYVNEKPYAVFELQDTLQIQSANFPVIMLEPKKITTLKFEILDVYKGDKYKDTAITELLFDGVGVH